jgi:acyl-coenzyme A thioesterase PaaI-like protein
VNKAIRPVGAISIPKHWSSTFLNNEALSEVQTYLNTDKTFVTEFTPRAGVEGPKAHSHGGFLATILDETMGSACWYNGLPVLAANLTVRYRKSVPLDGEYICTAKIDRLETKRAMVSAEISRGETVYCQATGVFVRVPIELLQKQPDMARMVEIVTSIKAGRTLQDLIELDKNNRRSWAPPTAENSWNDVAKRSQRLLGDVLDLAGRTVGSFLR